MDNVLHFPTGFMRDVAEIAFQGRKPFVIVDGKRRPLEIAHPPCRSNSGRIVHLRPNHSPDSDPPPEAA